MATKKIEIPESVNRFKLVGNLIALESDKAVIETVLSSMATGKIYTDAYPILIDDAVKAKLDGLEGTTVGIIGFVDHPAGSANSHLVALDAKAQSNATHFNRLQFTGPVFGADLMSRKEGKRQMGNVSLVIASRMLNAVTWKGAVTILKEEKVGRNSVITVKGRVRIREYASGADMVKTVELTCDQSQDVTVHFVPPTTDEFTFDEAETPAPTAQASAPAAPAKRQSTRRAT
jgi:hypothetical protein